MASIRPAPLPGTMKAVRIDEYGDSSRLKLEQAPVPRIEKDQVLVRVRYAGLNPADWKKREGRMKSELPFPLTMGLDFAGEMADAGNYGVDFQTGERVFGFANGTYAEYAAAQNSWVAPMPESMSFETAAALPTSGSTALQLIRDAVKATPGMRILIHGAAGGVGSLATQIARAWGARVIGTASEGDIPYLRSLGAAETIDYRRERFEDKARDVDAVVDLIGGETLARSYSVVRKGGVVATAAGKIDEAAAQKAGVRGVSVWMKCDAKDLTELATMVEQNRLKPRLGKVFPLEQAREAQETSEKGQARGKLLLKVG